MVARLRAAFRALFGARQYAAAKSGGALGAWHPASQNVNVEIASSQVAINARVRQLVRDMPHAARAVDVLSKWIIGGGLVLQSRIVGPDGKLARGLNTAVEDAWKWWSDEADLSGVLHLHDMQALAVRQLAEVGETLLVKTATKAPGRFLPLALRILEADRLGEAFGAAPLPGNEIYQGVEYDPRTGRRQAYWFSDDSPIGVSTWGTGSPRAVRLPAYRIIHPFETLRPGQLRGVSPFAPAVLLAHGFRDFLEAEIDGAKMAARFLTFVTTGDPTGTMAAFGVTNETVTAYPGTFGASETTTRKIEEIGTAIQQYLLPNEKVEIAHHNRPGDSFTPFTRFCLRTYAALMGVPYELLSGDYEGLNYSVLRGVRNDFAQSIAALRARFVRQFCVPVQREFLDWCVLTGRLKLADYQENPWPYLRSVWLGPGMAPVDPLKEGRADADAIAARLKSPQEAILARGRDPEEMLDECAQWDAMLDERGLVPAAPASPLQANPAALTKSKSKPAAADEGDEPPARAQIRRVQ